MLVSPLPKGNNSAYYSGWQGGPPPPQNGISVSEERLQVIEEEEVAVKEELSLPVGNLRLNKIELCGFKSFADRTSFAFDAGVTGIVGPNGCGKSNIADAFRWVMGEQSAKSLRGEKMHDVIFAGTSRRKPSNFSEVTLTFSNAAGSLPVPFDEVQVTRRLLRTGESEYRLNGNAVRLKDIQALFYDSGIGKDAFAIIEQGKIDEIIIRSPEERRAIFEQAAGIHGYRQRWRETERKLTQTEANLTRVADILREVDKQMHLLEKQVVDAQRFKQDKNRLSELEHGLLVARWHRTDRARRKVMEEAETIKVQLQTHDTTRSDVDEKCARAKVSVEEHEKNLQLQTEELYRRKSAREVKAIEGQSSRKRLQETVQNQDRLQHELTQLQEEQAIAQEELLALRAQLDQLKGALDAADEKARAGQKEVSGSQRELARFREAQQHAAKQQIELVQRSHVVNSRLRESQVRLESGQERLARLKTELDRLSLVADQHSTLITQRRQTVEELTSLFEQQKLQLASAESLGLAKRKASEEAKRGLEALLIELADVRARDKVLRRLKEEMEGFSSGTKKILKEASNPSSPLHGKVHLLCEAVSSQKGYELALAAVMRPYSQTLIIDSEDDLKALWDFALREKLTDFSITTLSLINRATSSSANQASPTQFAGHDALSQALLASSVLHQAELEVQNTTHLAVFEQVSPSGVYIDRRGVIFYPATGSSNAFLREAELKQLSGQIVHLEEQKGELGASVKQLAEESELAAQQRSHLDKEHRQLEMKLVEANFALQRVTKELEESGRASAHYHEEAHRIEEMQRTLQQEISKLTDEQEQGRKLLDDHQKQVAETEQALQEKLSSLQGQGQLQRDLEKVLSEAHERYQRQLSAIKLAEMRLEDRLKQQKRTSDELERLAGLRSNLEQTLSGFDSLLEGAETEVADASRRCQELEQAWRQWKATLAQMELESSKETQARRVLQENVHKLELTLAQHDSTCQGLEAEAQERLSLVLPETSEENYPLEDNLEVTEREVRRLRREVEKADHINLASIDEFEGCKARHQFLSTQMADLEQSKTELQQIIAELDALSRQKFAETFEKIRENFRKQFAILFEGGEADLLFVGSEDVLEAGLEIIAKPPGKQPRSIKLLSGGEKCLTAMALLFALFEVKPAPFCILDEIDAPLDDSNVSRFLRVLQPFMAQTQFLIITHNKITMSVADVLYGVSMEEKGVSKRISIQFERQTASTP